MNPKNKINEGEFGQSLKSYVLDSYIVGQLDTKIDLFSLKKLHS